MSELRREALRRYQQPQVSFNASEYVISRIAPTPPALQAIRADAKRKGTNKLTMAQINREVEAVRHQHDRKTTKRT